MSSEWMKVMLDEIARKKTEAEQADAEAALREAEPAGAPARESVAEPISPPPDDAGDE